MERYRSGMVFNETYELLSRLGQGGMGEVWTAQHLRLPEKPLAVKVIYHDHPQLLERLRREARVMAGLNHPNIATVIDLDTLPNGHPFMVMELLKGISLTDKIKRGDYKLAEVDHWLYQIADALSTAHASGIIHRDLKPDNLFLCDDGTLKVLDFGISKISFLDQLSISGALMGTPYYMSPEQVNGEEVDARSDLFALGLVAIELLTKQRPINGDSLPRVFKAIREYEKPACPKGFDPERWLMIDRAIASDRDQRDQSVAAWIKAFLNRELPKRQVLQSNSTNEPTIPSNSASLLDETAYPHLIETVDQIDEAEMDTQGLLMETHEVFIGEDTQGEQDDLTHRAEAKGEDFEDKGVFEESLLEDTHDQEFKSSSQLSFDDSRVGQRSRPQVLLSLLVLGLTTAAVFAYTSKYFLSVLPMESKKLTVPAVHKQLINGDAAAATMTLTPAYLSAISRADHLPQSTRAWASLVLIYDREERSQSTQELQLIKELREALKESDAFSTEAVLNRLLSYAESKEDQELKQLTIATLTTAVCARDSFKAQRLYKQLSKAEQGLIEKALKPCKGLFFDMKSRSPDPR